MAKDKLLAFLDFCFGEQKGYICIARRGSGSKVFSEEFFPYPSDLNGLIEHIEQFGQTHDMWFCPQMLTRPERRKHSISECGTAWADLDTCPPDKCLVEPSIVIESSPHRYQALWRFHDPIPAHDAENISRRIAYRHQEEGADTSGWDLTQLLRVPGTYNHKYSVPPPQVLVISIKNDTYSIEDFSEYPRIEEFEWSDLEFPEELPDRGDVNYNYRQKISPVAGILLTQAPSSDWSKDLWTLELSLLESGMSPEEVFVMVRESPVNKYDRDERGEIPLWKEVCKAYEHYVIGQKAGLASRVLDEVRLLADDDRKEVQDTKTLVEEYVEWARSLGDAAWQYHQAGIFVILSSILGSHVRLPTSFGRVNLNLWFLLLANTTLTRKTTAMDVAMDILGDVDPDAVLATDGSIEGMFTAMSHRSGRSSVFLRDEFSGLLDMMNHKDYYAGMAETLTKLYDGRMLKKVLRKETIEVKDPILIIFAGGIKSRIFELLNVEHVISGFLPRFIFITAEADITKLRPLGPPTVITDRKRDTIIKALSDLKFHYSQPQTVKVDGKELKSPKEWRAELTADAWATYNAFEAKMTHTAMESKHSDTLLPTFDRLAKSGLKVATMFAALRREQEVVIQESDIIRAFFYVEQWATYSLEVLSNIDKPKFERLVDRVFRTIKGENGVKKAEVMQVHRLTSRSAQEVFDTLEQRGMIFRQKEGPTEKLFMTDGAIISESLKEVEASVYK